MSAVYNNYCLGQWHGDCDGQARDGVCLCPCHKEARDRKIKITNEEYFTLDDPPENKVEGDDDPVNHPQHYTSDPSGVECITITRHRNFNIGNAIKYLWRAGLKKSSSDPLSKQIEDLEKARWYIADEIARLRGESQNLQTDFRKRWSELQEGNKEAFTEEIARNYVEYKDEDGKTRLYRVKSMVNWFRGFDFRGKTGELVSDDLRLNEIWAKQGCSIVLRFPEIGMVCGFRPHEVEFVGYKEG